MDSAIFIERSNRNNKKIEELRRELRQLQEPDDTSSTIDNTRLLIDLLEESRPMLEFEPSIFRSMVKHITVYPEKFCFHLTNGLRSMKEGDPMKKIRYFPFGYHMTNGKIEIVPGEAELLRLITARYLEGWSLLRLAGMAEQSGIPYRENAHDWNKNVIARILDDVRYWNGESYPPVFSRELGRADRCDEKEKSHTAVL